MRLRNNIFAAAFDYLKREKGIKTQKRLAELMEVSEDTITRILKDRTEVTEDIITKLQTASGCIFNLQWLRGEDSNCMLAKDINKMDNPTPAPQAIDYSFLIEKAVEKATAYADKTIAILEKQVADKDKQIADLRSRVRELEMLINSQSFGNAIERSPFPVGVADDGSVHILVDKG